MSFFNGLEVNLEKYIEGFFKGRLKGRIQPMDIAKLLVREMRDKKRVSVNKVYVPNVFTVSMAVEDWSAVVTIAPALAEELQGYLKQKAQEKDFTLVAQPLVKFSEEPTLEAGKVSVCATFGVPVQEVGGNSGPAGESEDTRSFRLPGNTLPVPVMKLPEKYCLQVTEGQDKGRLFYMDGHSITVGRRQNCNIILTDASVSRRHAAMDMLNGQWLLTDMESTNGTFVNGVRITKKELHPGDAVKFGSTLCVFKVE